MNVNISIAILAPIFVARLPLRAVAIYIDPALSFDGIIGQNFPDPGSCLYECAISMDSEFFRFAG